MPRKGDRLVTRDEIAEELWRERLRGRHFHRWQKLGLLTPIRLGRETQYWRSEIEKFLDSLTDGRRP